MKHAAKPSVVAYVQRALVTDWKRLVLYKRRPTFLYGSNDGQIFAPKLRQGGTLWIVSSLPGRSPALVARLEVTKVRERTDPALGLDPGLLRHFREWKWIAKATSDSEFFGHNDAARALLETVYERPSGRLWKPAGHRRKWRGSDGLKFLRPALVAEKGKTAGGIVAPGVKPFETLAGSRERSVFVSWKWSDNSRETVLRLAHALADEGCMPWLDVLALPRARALRKVERDAPKLERLLRYGYRRCAVVLAISSPNYGTRSPGSDRNWTRREWVGSVARGACPQRLVYRPSRRTRPVVLSDCSLRIEERGPVQAARYVRALFDSAELAPLGA